MRKYLPRPRTFLIIMVVAAIAVAIFGPNPDVFRSGLLVLLVIAITLLVTAVLEWRRLFPRPKAPNIIAMSVMRNDGRREVVSLDPNNDESVENFTRALQEDIAARTSPEEREALHEYARVKVDRELASANRA